MSIPFDSAFSPVDSTPEPTETVERQPNCTKVFGSTESFCEGVAPQATRYAMSIVRVWADAEEIVQEAFCRLIQSKQLSEPSEQESPKNPQALVFATVRNLAIDQLRKQKKRRFEPVDLGQIENALVEPDEKLARLEQSVEAILKELPSQWSDALQLKINGGLSYQEIADILNATTAQIRTWIYRARKQLDQELRIQGLVS